MIENISKCKVLSIDGLALSKLSINEIPIWTKPFAYTNLADPSSDEWKKDYRLNSSGYPTAAEGYTVTQLIPFKVGDVLRVKGVDLRNEGQRAAYYDEAGTTKGVYYFTNSYSSVQSESSIKDKITYKNGVSSYILFETGDGKFRGENGAFFRLCYENSAVSDDEIVITLNQEIND